MEALGGTSVSLAGPEDAFPVDNTTDPTAGVATSVSLLRSLTYKKVLLNDLKAWQICKLELNSSHSIQ